MLRCLSALALTLVWNAAVAQAGDPLQSKDCRLALDALDVQQAAALAARVANGSDHPDQGAVQPKLEASRRQAAQTCLGGSADAPTLPQHQATVPIAIRPIVMLPSTRPLQAVAPDPSFKRAEPPTQVTGCDAAGCWVSDGTRMQRVGPNLQGPRGLCSVQANILHCP